MIDSIAALREALALSPENLPLRLLIARTLLDAGELEGALTAYSEVLARAPDRVDARLGAGRAALGLGREAEVRAAWGPVTAQLGPEELRELARLQLRAGELDAARKSYQSLLAANPGLRDLELDRALRGSFSPTTGSEPPVAPAPPGRPATTFADVGGLETLKERLRMDIVYPLRQPELFRAYGKKAGGGLLLYGPPGCGKTFLARAAAGESEAHLIVVEIPQVLDMWLGESEKRLHALFEEARQKAPTILFFDEIEAIGASRHQLRHGPGRRLVNQLLAEMDGALSENQSVLVVGATNAPWDVDPALRRPGRFDRVVFVPPPDAAGREAILRLLFVERPVDRLDYAAIARKTGRFSGADLALLAQVASERALAEAVRTGKLRPITQGDLLASIDKVRPTTLEWLDTAKRYVSYANQAGLYDDVKQWLDREPG